MMFPGPDDLASAFNIGVDVLFGYPVTVRYSEGIASLDLNSASKGHKNPWIVRQSMFDGAVVRQRTASNMTLHVGNMAVSGHDLSLAEHAISLVPDEEDRHSAGANESRRAAGRIASRISNVMIRARLLDAMDAWSGALGDLLDRDPEHGELYSIPEIDAKALLVTCPSTGRRYVHRVPLEMGTAEEARLWSMGVDESPEVET